MPGWEAGGRNTGFLSWALPCGYQLAHSVGTKSEPLSSSCTIWEMQGALRPFSVSVVQCSVGPSKPRVNHRGRALAQMPVTLSQRGSWCPFT